MADYKIIADMGQLLIDKLRNGLVPELIQNAEAISLGKDSGEFILSLTLYDIQVLSRSIREHSLSSPLSLKYILSVNSKAAAEAKAVAEHQIIGKAISILANTPIIKRESGLLGDGDMPVEITLDSVSLEDRIKICGHIFEGFRTSVFYSVGPIFIDSQFASGKAARVLNG